jgi:hypothetical protein
MHFKKILNKNKMQLCINQVIRNKKLKKKKNQT